MKAKRKNKAKIYKPKKKVIYRQQPEILLGELSGLKGQFKPNLIPEIKVTYNKGKRVLGKITCSDDVADFIRRQYKRGTIDTQEYFNILYLNAQNGIIGYYRQSKGGVNSTVADIKLIFGVALKSLSSSIILSHNHPAGITNPSEADLKVTEKLKKVAKIHDIYLMDHIIITKESHFSFADKGMI